MKICIANCSNPIDTSKESDDYVDFRMGRALCFEKDKCVKQCRSWHGWAYALESEFFVLGRKNFNKIFSYDAVVILVNRDMQAVLPLVKKLKLMKKKVAISHHEGVGDLIGSSGAPNENPAMRWIGLYDLVQAADFYVNLFGQMQSFFDGWFGKDKVKYCTHGAPTDWEAIKKYQIPFEERPYDILIGTRTLHQRLPRNTLVALGVANKFAREGSRVLYLSEDGNVRDLFDKIGFNKIEVQQGPLSYEEWLKLIGRCKIVCMRDDSLNLAQIIYDCSMMNTLCVGSTCWNSVLVKTDDHADTRLLEAMIHEALLNNKQTNYSKEYLASIHPDAVKKELMEIFK